MSQYVIRGGREGYERLQLLARARRGDTVDLLEHVGFPTDARCLDLGCGGGEVTFELARLAGPAGHVVGLDMDEIKLDLARNAAQERGIANVEFRAGNVNQWSDPAAYDLVYSRFLLQHLSQPREVVKRMWAAVRPGGRLVIEDADFDGLFCWPPNEGFSFYARMYPHVLELRGGDPASGRKLYDYFLDAGIPSPQVRLAQGFGSAGDTKMLALATLEATAEPIVAAGLASEDEVRAAVDSLSAYAGDATTVIGDPRVFQVWAVRQSA